MKRKTLFTVLPIVILSLLTYAFTSFDGPLDVLLSRLNTYSTNTPQEKLHMHFDKPFYSLGEDIWFKVYVVDARQNLLSAQSKIVYVDLVDDQDSVKQSLVLPLVNGTASGNIHLDDSVMNAGNYHIYAYTRWMQNFDNGLIFKKSIPIVNALRGAVVSNLENKTIITPEGKRVYAIITYNTDSGQPFAGKQVNYVLQANNKNIFTGKGVTGPDGKLIINMVIKSNYNNSDIVIKTIFTPEKGNTATQDFVIKPLEGVANVQFFPEGGHLVNGIRTKIGFKAVKPDGLSENITGYIADDKNEHVAEFKSEHAGMGVFALLPVAGSNYTAVIKHEDGSEKRYALPKAEASGYVLNINHVGKDSLSVRISASPDLADGREITLIAQCNGVAQFAAQTKLAKASNTSYVPAKKFRTGISQFTLFTADMKPVAERLVFIDHNDGLNAEVKTDNTTYAKRGKVKMDLKITDNNGEPVVGTFSLAVTDESKVTNPEDEEVTILSNLLLTSDIKGYIEQPNYYFNPQNANRQKHLDALLLTQGWRRFSWTDIIAEKYPVIKYEPEQSPTVTGSIVTMSGKPVPNGKVTLLASNDGQPYLIDTVADIKGHFIFKDLYFPDNVRVAIRASDAKDRGSVKIIIDKKPVIQYPNAGNADVITDYLKLNNYLNATRAQFAELDKGGLFNNAIALKEVMIKAKKDWNADKVIPNSINLSPGTADWVIKAEKLAYETNLLFALNGISGIRIKNDIVYRVGHVSRLQDQPAATKKTARGTVPLTVQSDDDMVDVDNTHPMMLMVDGVRMTADHIKDIPPDGVAGVELLTSGTNTAIYGNDGYWGVILVTTKRGGETVTDLPRLNVGHFKSKGYAATKEFYSPAYDAPSDKAQVADLRSTIYWNPNIVTDDKGQASVGYFNADGTGTYKVTLEGMDTKGGLVRKTYTYLVK